jgi:DNA (cytosine-5)-methyltransferase 1
MFIMKKKIRVGSDFSGVGAFNQALQRLGIDYHEVFACDMDKYARQTFIHNYGEPDYYPENVYNRDIPTESLDIYMTSPPCQAFSLAGKRLGKEDKRGILFFNSHEFIKVNKPRYFIFENVKGLLSDDGGRTFNEWITMLAGKSVNGNAVMFPYEDSVPYHVYWKVLNAKEHGVPQNRERVFIVGIRDDADNNFRFPAEEFLTKRLKDVLEEDVDDKYYLSDKIVDYFERHKEIHEERGNGFKFEPHDENTICSNAVSTKCGSRQTDPYIKIKSATQRGYEEAAEGDSIIFSVPNSETRRGRVGNQVAQTLDTACSQGVVIVKNIRTEDEKQKRKEHFKKTGKDTGSFKGKKLIVAEQNFSDTILANANPKKEGLIGIASVQKDNVVIQLNQSKESGGKQPYQQNRIYDSNGINPALNAGQSTWGGNIVTLNNNYKIRRLTPRECFRLMDFPDTFTWPVSDSQAYKQAGNSIVVAVLEKIIKNLRLEQ